MPVKCPRCDVDYRWRNNIRTPLRNHRTGFQKACQVLASALAREMPASRVTSKGKVPTRKLVIFSDSRQDAAKLAAGMERDHYRDMVRVALIDARQRANASLEAFLKQRAAKNAGVFNHLATLGATALATQLQTDVAAGRAPNVELANDFKNRYPAESGAARDWFDEEQVASADALTQFQQMLKDYPNTALPEVRDRVFATVLEELGTCPGGTSFRARKVLRGQGLAGLVRVLHMEGAGRRSKR